MKNLPYETERVEPLVIVGLPCVLDPPDLLFQSFVALLDSVPESIDFI